MRIKNQHRPQERLQKEERGLVILLHGTPKPGSAMGEPNTGATRVHITAILSLSNSSPIKSPRIFKTILHTAAL